MDGTVTLPVGLSSLTGSGLGGGVGKDTAWRSRTWRSTKVLAETLEVLQGEAGTVPVHIGIAAPVR